MSSDPLCAANYATDRAGSARPIRFGIDVLDGAAPGTTPAYPLIPAQSAKTDAALRALQPPRRPALVVRLNRMFESDGEAGIQAYAQLARHYGKLGFKVELQVRYHPSAADNGNIPKWLAYVRRVVDVFGRIPSVVSLTVPNETNLPSPDTSDGGYLNALDALVQGLPAAKAEALRRHFLRLQIGFNYAWDDPLASAYNQYFWSYLNAHGGANFARSVDFVGIDAYPGTYYPPGITSAQVYGFWVSTLATMRKCWLPQAGLGRRVALWVTENGYATPQGGTSEADQVLALRNTIAAMHDYSRTYGLTDYRYYNLRDANSASPEFTQTWGLVHDDYARKPSFGAFRSLIIADGPPPLHRKPKHSRHHRKPRHRKWRDPAAVPQKRAGA